MLAHPIKQGGDIAGHAWRGRKSRRIGSGQLVDDKLPCVDLCSVLRLNGAIDGGRKHDPSALLEANKGL